MNTKIPDPTKASYDEFFESARKDPLVDEIEKSLLETYGSPEAMHEVLIKTVCQGLYSALQREREWECKARDWKRKARDWKQKAQRLARACVLYYSADEADRTAERFLEVLHAAEEINNFREVEA